MLKEAGDTVKKIRALISFIFAAAVLSVSALPAEAIGFEAEKIYESVFVIYSENSLGSGFAVGENCIVTNAHVIENERDITVESYGGDEYEASVLGINKKEDIAVLVVKDAHFPYLGIAELSEMKTGDDIYAIGAPKGMAYTLTKGGISAKERAVGAQTYIQIDAPINKGNSGGPLLNDDGKVLGMNTLKMTDSEGIGLAIPMDRVCRYIESLGVGLDEAGNVSGSVEVTGRPEHTEKETDKEENNEQPEENLDSEAVTRINSIAVIVAVLSLTVNIVLVALLINKGKKGTEVPCDPRERTDFEIEILE